MNAGLPMVVRTKASMGLICAILTVALVIAMNLGLQYYDKKAAPAEVHCAPNNDR